MNEPNITAEEFKSSVQSRMKIKPLQNPYIDYRYIAGFPLATRYTASQNVLSKEELLSLGLKEDYLPDIMLARWQAAKRLAEIIKQKKMSLLDIADITKIDSTMLAKITNWHRPLSVGSESLVPLCYEVLHMSCHDLMFGEKGKVVLPGIYSHIAKCFSQLSVEEKDAVLENSDVVRKHFERLSPTTAGVGLHREPRMIARDRIVCLAHALGRGDDVLLGDEQNRRMTINVRAYTTDLGYASKVAFLMFLSKETGLALDYFLAEDFTAYVPCFYEDNGEEVEIKDRDALRFIGNVLSVDNETSTKMTAPLYAAVLAK